MVRFSACLDIIKSDSDSLQDLLAVPEDERDSEWAYFVNCAAKDVHRAVAMGSRDSSTYDYVRQEVFPLMVRARHSLAQVTNLYSEAMKMRLRVIAMYSRGVHGKREFEPLPPLTEEDFVKMKEQGWDTTLIRKLVVSDCEVA